MTASGQTDRKMSDVPPDPRVLRTRATLRQALMALLHKGDWGDITASDICRQAGVARSSFYEHYGCKADLLDEVFAVHMSAIPLSDRTGDALGALDWLVAHVADAPAFFANAMAGGRGDALLPRFRAALTRKLEQELTARAVPEADLKAAYVIGGSLAYLATEPGEEAGRVLQRMAAQIIG